MLLRIMNPFSYSFGTVFLHMVPRNSFIFFGLHHALFDDSFATSFSFLDSSFCSQKGFFGTPASLQPIDRRDGSVELPTGGDA